MQERKHINPKRVTPTGPGHITGVQPDVEYADEEQTGQLALGVPGEQRAIPGMAKEGKPAPTGCDPAKWTTDDEGYAVARVQRRDA